MSCPIKKILDYVEPTSKEQGSRNRALLSIKTKRDLSQGSKQAKKSLKDRIKLNETGQSGYENNGHQATKI